MLKIVATAQFKRDLKKAKRIGKNIDKLAMIVNKLACEEALGAELRDHRLKGSYARYRECHIEPDWILMYEIKENLLILSLARVGTHSEIFG